MSRFLLAAIVFASALLSQTITVANMSPDPWVGWARTTVDIVPPHVSGSVVGARYVLGRAIGQDLHAIDVHCSLAPNEERTFDLGASQPAAAPIGSIPIDPVAFFGGWATINGVPMGIRSIKADGAAVLVHLIARPQPMLFVDVWGRWYPDEPGILHGEARVTASNGAVPDMGATAATDVRFEWGDGWVHVAGAGPAAAGWGEPLVPAGTQFADGQARAMPIAVIWSRHVPDSGWPAAIAAARLSTHVRGVSRLWPMGNPIYPDNFDAYAWTRSSWSEAMRRLHTWEPGVTGPNPTSGSTGTQAGDQIFVRGETFLPRGIGAERIAYLSALRMAARPCHHLEADGRQADPMDHPQTVFWDGRPHWHPNVGVDKLGKVGAMPDSHGWSGPDRQHWLYNTVAAAARISDSPALQSELEQQSRIFLFQETVDPTLSTSTPDAARSVGWASLVAVHLVRGLEDRILAERVLARYRDRARMLYLPILGDQAAGVHGDIMHTFVDDPRLGPGAWWIPWQQAVAALGLDVAGEQFAMPNVRALALKAARAVMRDCWRLRDGRWESAPVSPVGTSLDDGGSDFARARRAVMEDAGLLEESLAESDPPAFDQVFNYFGMALAPWVVLRHDPTDARARALWTYLVANAVQTDQTSWLPPGLVLPGLPDPAPTTMVLSQWGVTWSFADPVEYGQFVNGDYWVRGPVNVVKITPASVVTNGRVVNGSMLNPPMTGAHGYDSTLYGQYSADQRVYVPALNVARSLPLEIAPGSSLVSTISQMTPPPPNSVSQINTAAVLTVLGSAPPADAFRPPYCGAKTIWTESQLDYTRLAHLAPVGGAPSLHDTAAAFERVWLDHCPHWTSGSIHPVTSMPGYYRDFTTLTGDAGLLLNCDFDDAAKRDLLIRFVQVGIDWYGNNTVGKAWGVNGHCNGRKFPILFAGRVLNDAAMLAVGTDHPVAFFGPDNPANRPVWFSEDGQTFYVAETSPGVYNWGVGGYTAANVGLPEWGNFHADGSAHNLSSDSIDWFANAYRRCCSANGWVGTTLATIVMGLRPEWGHEAHFDYMDRFMQVQPIEEWHRAWSPWQGAMWAQHRGGL